MYLGVNRSLVLLKMKFIHKLQSNLDTSNADGSLTMANSNSFLSPY